MNEIFSMDELFPSEGSVNFKQYIIQHQEEAEIRRKPIRERMSDMDSEYTALYKEYKEALKDGNSKKIEALDNRISINRNLYSRLCDILRKNL